MLDKAVPEIVCLQISLIEVPKHGLERKNLSKGLSSRKIKARESSWDICSPKSFWNDSTANVVHSKTCLRCQKHKTFKRREQHCKSNNFCTKVTNVIGDMTAIFGRKNELNILDFKNDKFILRLKLAFSWHFDITIKASSVFVLFRSAPGSASICMQKLHRFSLCVTVTNRRILFKTCFRVDEQCP